MKGLLPDNPGPPYKKYIYGKCSRFLCNRMGTLHLYEGKWICLSCLLFLKEYKKNPDQWKSF